MIRATVHMTAAVVLALLVFGVLWWGAGFRVALVHLSVFGPPLLVMFLFGQRRRRVLLRRTRLLSDGFPGTAVVVGVRPVGSTTRGLPVVQLTLRVSVSGSPDATRTLTEAGPAEAVARAVPGAILPVRADPRHPTEVVVDWVNVLRGTLPDAGSWPSPPSRLWSAPPGGTRHQP